MKLLIDTNGLRERLKLEQYLAEREVAVQSGFFKQGLLDDFQWQDDSLLGDLFYQLKLELSSSTNMRPLQKLFKLTPLMPDPYYRYAGPQLVGDSFSLDINSEADPETRLKPAVFLYLVLHGKQTIDVVRDSDHHSVELLSGQALFCLVHQKIYQTISVKTGDTAHAISALYSVVDPEVKFLPEDFDLKRGANEF